MKIEITKKQEDILITSMRSIGLLAREQDLPQPARDLLFATYVALQRVLRDLGLSIPLSRDGAASNGDQYPTDNFDQWESQK